MTRFIVTGTGTGIGKTIFSAALAQATGAPYWKPIQSVLEEESDSEVVARLAGVPIHPEAYRLTAPASPHFAAEIDGVNIDVEMHAHPPGNHTVQGSSSTHVPAASNTP